MGLGDSLGGMLQGALGGQGGIGGVLMSAFEKAGGLDGVVAKLNESGYGAQVNSWLGNGPNMPITTSQIENALGNEHLKQIATTLGIPMDEVSGLVAQHLPEAVDGASPDGTLQTP